MRNLGLGPRLYLMLAAAVLPLLGVVGFMAYADSRRADELLVAFQTYDLATQRSAHYKTFINGVADALDSGSVGTSAVEALAKASTLTTKLAEVKGKPNAIAVKLAEVLATVQRNSSVESVMPLREPIRAIDIAVAEEATAGQKQLSSVISESTEAAATQVLVVGITALCSIGLAAFLAFLIVGNLTRDMRRAIVVADRIAAGNLDGDIAAHGRDEIGKLMLALEQMKNGLRSIVGEIAESVQTMAAGDFRQRLAADGKQGFAREIGQSLNDLGSSLQGSVGGNPEQAVRVAQSIAAGELNVDVPVEAGDSRSAMAAMATMRNTLEATISDIRELVNFAADGDFARRMDVTTRQGYAKLLGELLNRVMTNAEEGLSDIQRVAGALAEGDLTLHIEQLHPGQFGETASSINTTIDNLRSLLSDVAGASASINEAVSEIVAGNQDLSRRREGQAIELQRVAGTIKELTSAVQRNSKSAADAQQRTASATQVAERGGSVVKASVSTMEDISRSSSKIGDIISVIDGIAFQTNLLALNAAVEAARAGEAGRGFAVVAGEVRNLAKRSADAARESSLLIQASTDAVKRGTEQAAQTGRAMDDIVNSFNQVNQLIADISRDSEVQAERVSEVNLAIVEIERATQADAALVEEAARASDNLKEQLNDLRAHVARFRLDDARVLPAERLLLTSAV
ncbi:MAG: methyl-accepting chemotaxis protein [Proteobacteria bacterium]|nr:methyl-accepting chemotaxis protein [Pseudomonadota bacterium]